MKTNAGQLYPVGAHAGAATPSEEIQFFGTTQETFYLLLDGADGSYSIQAYICGQWEELATGSLTDGVVETIVFDNYIPKAKVVLTPLSDALLHAEAYGQPAKFVG